MRFDSSTGMVEMDKSVWKKLMDPEKSNILLLCDVALMRYFSRDLK